MANPSASMGCAFGVHNLQRASIDQGLLVAAVLQLCRTPSYEKQHRASRGPGEQKLRVDVTCTPLGARTRASCWPCSSPAASGLPCPLEEVKRHCIKSGACKVRQTEGNFRLYNTISDPVLVHAESSMLVPSSAAAILPLICKLACTASCSK
eukprot:1157896-Pelagomonas_calceolata.AAC.6